MYVTWSIGEYGSVVGTEVSASIGEYVGNVGDRELTGTLNTLLACNGDVGSMTVYEELFSFVGEYVSGLYTSSDDSCRAFCSVV